ncbi:MAG: hypothetical protein AVDCRST_MAG36-1988 [uncultured Nocardioidaceae bacterium]|uniref:DUF1800 domain-containing protein n=1 Tax=uncultured Nocardioidaceae bacterium TaxID=253824 RepID=A0A6J4M6D5_9ACTN|nr:MAG: hypothetical protein AVDCRST_MAG36-1988 [uncultured Nocardioidaceae bacterium]
MARYVVAPYEKTMVPTARQLHVVNRLGWGYRRSTFKQLLRAGGETEWFEQQLDPASIVESRKAAAVDDWFPDLHASAADTWAEVRAGRRRHGDVARALAGAALLRRVYSRRPVLEQMVDFWSNHLHVSSRHPQAFTQRPAYDEVVRRHALGRFEDLLVEASLHPAMLIWLDNWQSVRGAPNENHGRELLELHTVGLGAGYTEAMVKDSAKILSGYTVYNAGASAWSGWYDPGKHTTGAVRVLDFRAANDAADGSQLAVDYLRYLARHPATATRIARKLAVRFVSDTPPPALVERVAQAYLASGTDIKETLRALVRSKEFWASAGQKVRTPMDDLVATCRVLGVKAAAPTDDLGFACRVAALPASTMPFEWPRPDGPPDTADVWAAPNRMLASWRMHWALGGGYWPRQDVTYKQPASWLPADRIRFDRFVDHLSRVLLGRPSTPELLEAACTGIDAAPGDVVTRQHAVIRYKMPRLCAVLLDTPAHMTR